MSFSAKSTIKLTVLRDGRLQVRFETGAPGASDRPLVTSPELKQKATAVAAAPVVEDAATDEAAQKKKSLAALREWVDHSKQRLEDWQKQVEEKARGALENIQHAVNPWAGVNKDVKVLADRIAELEAGGSKLELTEQQELWAIEQGFDEIVVKTKNKFYEMRGTLDNLEFQVVKYERHADDNGESKVYLSKKLDASVLKSHRLTRTVVQA